LRPYRYEKIEEESAGFLEGAQGGTKYCEAEEMMVMPIATVER
jgi:hypothetical protein